MAYRWPGYYGIDSVLLPLLGTPWTGTLSRQKTVKARMKTA